MRATVTRRPKWQTVDSLPSTSPLTAARACDGVEIALSLKPWGSLLTLGGTVTARDWQRRGACQHSDPELFFPIGSTGASVIEDIEKAKAICRVCPVQPECLRFALNTRQEFGIWGGTTEDERRAISKLMRARHAATPAAAPSVPVP
jgi:WhiB family redox-sensing transcriptional regulator